jgi:hypothetical protein
MWLCPECVIKEIKVGNTVKAMQVTVEQSRKIDSQINLKQDIFLNKTVAFVELQAAIYADESIAAEDKAIAFMNEVKTRIQKLSKVISERQEELGELQTEKRMYQVQAQEYAGRIGREIEEKYPEFRVTYAPAPITKKEKSSKPVKSAKASYTEAKEAAKKYGVEQYLSAIQMIMKSKGVSAEIAAKQFAEQVK